MNPCGFHTRDRAELRQFVKRPSTLSALPALRATFIGAAVSLVAAASTLAAVPGGSYRGTTSQGRRLTLAVARSKIKLLKLTWNARCETSTTGLEGLVTRFRAVRLRHRTWAAHGSYTAPSGNGYSESFQVEVRGRFARGRVRGSFRGSVIVINPQTHAYVDSCYAAVKLRARRR